MLSAGAWLVWAIVAAGVQPAVAASCLPAVAGKPMVAPSQPAAFSAALVMRPAPVGIGAPFTVAFQICSEAGSQIDRIAVDAIMPAHRHGMNYKPEIVSLGGGRFEARGFVFHMAGHWQITLSVYSAGKPTHLTFGAEVQ